MGDAPSQASHVGPNRADRRRLERINRREKWHPPAEWTGDDIARDLSGWANRLVDRLPPGGVR